MAAPISPKTDDQAPAPGAGSETLLSAILETSTAAFYALDKDWKFTYVNPAGAQLLRGSREDFLGVGLWDLFPHLEGSAFEAAFRNAMEGASQNIEEYYEPYDVWLAITMHPWSGGIILSVKDVTRRRELEEELRQSQKMEAVGRLAGGIAHDFNNLLTVVSTNTELALAQVDPSNDLYVDLSEIKSAVGRATTLTGQLLTFSRKHVSHTVILDMNTVLSSMQLMLRRVLGEDINLVVTLAPQQMCVEADESKIEQVIMNLAVNARDSMPEGGAMLFETALVEIDKDAAVRLSIEPGHYVSLRASDTGCGIDPAVLPHIFEPFFTTKEQGRGTGLGLSTVYGVARQFNGSVKADSTLGRGTTFTIYLPLAKGSVTPIESANDAETTLPRGKEVILLVEDEAGVRESTKRALEKQGYTVVTARNGMEALIICEENNGQFDMLLTDVVMPEINGTVLADRILQRLPGLPVVFMSGYTGEVTEYARMSADSFIAKPFAIGALMRKVRDVLDRKQSSSSSSSAA